MAFIDQNSDEPNDANERPIRNHKFMDQTLLETNSVSGAPNNLILGVGGVDASHNLSSLRLNDSYDEDYLLDSHRVDQSS